MNKIFKALKKIGTKIYKLVDQLIVVPISSFIYRVTSKLNKDNKLEKILNRPNILLYISLALAIILFYLVDSKAISFINTNAEILRNQPVEVIYNSSAYVIEGVPETVDITLIGKKSELYLAKQLGDNEVVVDLTDYEASDKPVKVKFSYKKHIDSLDYKIDPSYVTVTIKKKVSDKKTVSYDLLNKDSLDEKLSVKSVELSKTEVIVRGAEETLDKIASIKALIDLSDEAFKSAGTYDVDTVKLVAYASDGSILPNVEIVATNISAKVVLESYSKVVPVRIITTGELVSGKAISSITINNKPADSYDLTIYGDESALESINYIPINIDVKGQGNNGSRKANVTIEKPAGVRALSESNVAVELNFDEAKQKTIVISGIKTKNVSNDLVANLASASEMEIEVQLVAVESVLSAMGEEPTGITAYVDLKDKGAGTHTVDVQIEGEDSRIQYIVTKKVSVVLSKK
jgi:YbbR domain-containing protein